MAIGGYTGTGTTAPAASDSISIVGLSEQYTAPVNISAQVSVSDPAYDCGDLYVTVYDVSSGEKKSVGQHAFFSQCYGTGGMLPIDDEFTEKIDSPGKYSLVAQMFDKGGNKFLTVEKQFTAN